MITSIGNLHSLAFLRSHKTLQIFHILQNPQPLSSTTFIILIDFPLRHYVRMLQSHIIKYWTEKWKLKIKNYKQRFDASGWKDGEQQKQHEECLNHVWASWIKPLLTALEWNIFLISAQSCNSFSRFTFRFLLLRLRRQLISIFHGFLFAFAWIFILRGNLRNTKVFVCPF